MPLVAGATLVPNASATSLFGEELAEFLEARGVTCLCCVPTLLASIERDLPKLRILLIGGEACPPALVKRWSRPGRTLLNSYGPTEDDRDRDARRADAGAAGDHRPAAADLFDRHPRSRAATSRSTLGEAGEIGIAGIGVAEGYLNRPELTRGEVHRGLPRRCRTIRRAASIAPATSGASTEDGEIEYLGRIDTQIKLRGYRIELTEIESVLLEIPGDRPGRRRRPSSRSPARRSSSPIIRSSTARRAPDRDAIVALMRARLPGYMTPGLSRAAAVHPDARQQQGRPAASCRRRSPRGCASADAMFRPRRRPKRRSAEALDGRARPRGGVDRRRFLRRIRRPFAADGALLRPGPADRRRRCRSRCATSMRIRRSAASPARSTPPGPCGDDPRSAAPTHRPTDFAYYALRRRRRRRSMSSFGGARGRGEPRRARLDLGRRRFAASRSTGVRSPSRSSGSSATTALAVAAKWAADRPRPAGAIPLWSFAYFRFWAAKLIVRSAPANAFAGTPLFNAYLRLLGAKIGRNAVIAIARRAGRRRTCSRSARTRSS